MRGFLKSRLRTAWLWPLVLLALPDCGLKTDGLPGDPPPEGPEPRTSAVMCDIPKLPDPSNPDSCASPQETAFGMSMSRAAIALAQHEQNSLVLDFSLSATDACGGPRKIEYWSQFPDGSAICLNCATQIPDPFPDRNAVCVSQCITLAGTVDLAQQPSEGIQTFCETNAHLSTNFDKTQCFNDVCSVGGTPLNFDDPRREQEHVKWTNFFGTSAVENTLTRDAATTGTTPDDFNAGAASVFEQLITRGDAWIEFEVADNTKSHAIGVSGATFSDDMNPTLTDILFAIDLNSDSKIYFLEHGSQVGPSAGGYTAGQRFRIHITDNNDGTAKITYGRLNGPCMTGTICLEDPLVAQQTSPDHGYPFRVDASLREKDAQLKNVTIMRIIE